MSRAPEDPAPKEPEDLPQPAELPEPADLPQPADLSEPADLRPEDLPSDEPTAGLDEDLEAQVYDILLGTRTDQVQQIEDLCREHPDSESVIRNLVQQLSEVNRILPEQQRVLDAPALEGTTQLGEYKLLREVGRGGMGIVFEAWQPSLRRTVALKILPADRTWGEGAVERFQREAATAARMQHEGIVEVHATGEEKGHHYLAMEFVEGAPLSKVLSEVRKAGLQNMDAGRFRGFVEKHLQRRSRATGSEVVGPPRASRRGYLENAVEIAAQVAEALDHAHRAGVAHRDVKPSNILVRQDGRAVLTDFGLARDEGLPVLTRTGAFAGTPYYASPEQARGESGTDHRTDIFSLGATLYELITMQPPFPGEGTQQILENIQRVEPKDPSRTNPQVPGDLAAIVLKALEKDLSARYQTAAELATDLRAFLEFRPVSARKISTVTRARRWVRREPKLASLIAVLLAGIPTVSILAGVWIANAPKVAAAEEQEQLDRIEGLLTSAQLHVGRDNVDGAIQDYQQILAEFPAQTEALAGLAYTLNRDDRAKEALALLDEARAGPEPSVIRRIRFWTLRKLKRTEEAKALSAELGEPEDPFELLLMAEEQRVIGNNTADWDGKRRSLMYFKAALANSKRARPLIHCRLAMMAGEERDVGTARRMAAAVQRLWPDTVMTQEAVALAYFKIEPDKALASIDKAIAQRPKMFHLHHVRAMALSEAGRYPDAEKSYLEAIRLNPLSPAPHEGLSDLYYFNMRRYADSLKAAEESIRLNRRNQKPLWLKAHALKRLNRLEDSLAAWQHLIAVHPDFANAYNNLADVAAKLGRHKLSLQAAQKAVKINPRYVIGLSTLASAWQSNGNIKKAVETYERAIKVDPKDVYNLRALVLLLIHKNTPAALRNTRRAVEVARMSVAVKRTINSQMILGQALAANGEVGEARRVLTVCHDALVDHPNPRAKALLRTVKAELARLKDG